MESVSIGKIGLAIGNSSYALYLSHVFVVAALGFVFSSVFTAGWQETTGLPELYIMVSVLLSLVVGWIIHEWLEKPAGYFLKARVSFTATKQIRLMNFGSLVVRR